MSAVYAIVNKANSFCYVGFSIDPKGRARNHFKLLRNGKHTVPLMLADWESYGEDMFGLRILEQTSDDPVMQRDRELHWMKYFQAQGKLYNDFVIGGPLVKGGFIGCDPKEFWADPELREKLLAKRKVSCATDEYRRKNKVSLDAARECRRPPKQQMTAQWADRDSSATQGRKKGLEKCVEHVRSPEERKRRSERMKALNADPAYKAKRLEGLRNRKDGKRYAELQRIQAVELSDKKPVG